MPNAVVVTINPGIGKAHCREVRPFRAPMPLVLAIAPNGAIMGGFPTKFTEEALSMPLAVLARNSA